MGKLSKPQRSRKHKKLKPVDPFYIGNKSAHKNVKRSYNREPLSDSRCEFTGEQNVVKSKSKTRRRAKKSYQAQKSRTVEMGCEEPEGVPEFKRQVGESERDFMYRVDCETRAVIHQSQLDDKYQRSTTDAERRQADNNATATRRDKKILRLKRKKEKSLERRRSRREDKTGGFARLQDVVKFGEVVLEPPSLSAAPRHSAALPQNTPQERRGIRHKTLMLSRMFTADSSGDKRVSGRRRQTRRYSMAERVMLDSERQRAITLYRHMKASQLH